MPEYEVTEEYPEYSLEDVENDELQWQDPCHEFDHSILFFLIVLAFLAFWAFHGWLLYVR